jgi:xylose isomerase
MRTYLILKEKAAQYNSDTEIQALVGELAARGGKAGSRVKYSAQLAQSIRDEKFDLEGLRAKGYGYERLDQLTMELLLGVR